MDVPELTLHYGDPGPHKVLVGNWFMVEVEFFGDKHKRRLWLHGHSGSTWSLNRDSLLWVKENPMPFKQSFEVYAGAYPGKYGLSARLLDQHGKVEYRSPVLDVEVVDDDGAVQEGASRAA